VTETWEKIDRQQVPLAGIPKLRGVQNYQDWKFQVKTYLENRDLWTTVPARNTNGELVTAIDTNKDRLARTTLCMLVEPVCFPKVRTAETSEEVWSKLQDAYEDKGWGRRLRLQQALWECRLENFRSMDE